MNEKQTELDNEIKQENQIESKERDLSSRKKAALIIIFLLGLPLSYPTIFPLGLLCSGTLFLQNDKKFSLLGLILIVVQLLYLLYFGFSYAQQPI
jgi:hypothetical protein